MTEELVRESWADISGAEPSGLPVRVGDRFPNLILPSIENEKPMAVSGLDDRHLLLHFFASW